MSRLEKALEHALNSWQQWNVSLPSPPTLVTPLAGGKTNQNFLLQSNGLKMVLRLNNDNSERLGINRHQEAVILEAVSKAGIAPAVYHCDPEAGVLVTEYLSGQLLDVRNPDALLRLQALFEQVHSLRPDIPVFDYVLHGENYWQRLEQSESQGLLPSLPDRNRLREHLERLQSASGQGLCHHDPVAGNIIDCDGRLYLLDWEYSGLGAPDFDRAAIRAEWSGFCVTQGQDEIQLAADTAYKAFCQLWQALN